MESLEWFFYNYIDNTCDYKIYLRPCFQQYADLV